MNFLRIGYKKSCFICSVTPALKEPVPGWVDNLNGPTGVMIGAAKGVIRSVLCYGELQSEIIPVDIAINGIVLVPYHCSLSKSKPAHIPVYNLTINDEKKRTWKWVMDVGRDFGLKYPFEVGLWYPDGNMTSNKLYHYFCMIFFMWLPAYVIDFLLGIFGQRRFMVRVQTKISVGLEVLSFFTTRAWYFKSTNFQQIYADINDKDKIMFKVNTDDVDDYEYLKTSILGGRQYVLKEPLSSLPRARIHLKMMYCLDRFCKGLILFGLLYWISSKMGLFNLLQSTIKYGNIEMIK